MLDAIVGLVVVLLVVAGILVMLGPDKVARRIRSIRTPAGIPALFEPRRPREALPVLNAKTQRVLVASARLANWLRAHGHEEASRELRNAAARMTGNEP